jgi:kumamolisin
MRRTRLAVGLALGVATVMAPVAALSTTASAATASGPAPNTPEKVATGVNAAALPGATVFGTTPASTPETVSFILTEQNLASLKIQVQLGIHRDLSVSQFASQYGQTPANIAALTSYLASFGIKTTVYADNVDVSATGTAGEFDKALSVTQNQYHVPALAGHDGLPGLPAQDVHGSAQAPLLPYRLAHFVTAILGLSNYGPFNSDALHVNTKVLKPQPSSSNACTALTGSNNACNLPQNFASNYNLAGLYAKGATGQGQSLAIVTLAAVDPGAPEYYWSNVAHINRTGTLTINNIDGGPGAPSNVGGSGESDLDVEQSGGLAPGANVIVYQAPNTDPGFADSFFTAASQDIAGSVSASWGESETIVKALVLSGEEPTSYLAAFDEAFLEFAMQGQAGFLSTGDQGAYDAIDDLGTTNLAVDVDADSPYITAAGGTTLPWTGTVSGPDGTVAVTQTTQRAWGWDYLWPALAKVTGTTEAEAAEANIGGDGGGFSVDEPTPSYQLFVSGTRNYHAVEYLTPTEYETIVTGLTEPTAWSFNPTPAVTSGTDDSGRAVPDVSTDADPYSGYLLYSPSFAQAGDPVLEGGWGGTSFVAPQLNGSTAVIDSYLGHRVGFWNPTIYGTSLGFGASPFTQLSTASTSNDNLYYTGNPGQAYNPAVGLGYPNLTALAARF